MNYKINHEKTFNGLFIKKILYFSEIDSTNLYSKRNIDNLVTGDVILSSFQTNGLGQRGKSWQSDKNLGLYFSIIIKNNLHLEKLQFLTLLTAYSLSTVIKNLELDVSIKEPNDIYIGNKKISGILVENQISKKNNKTIIGIGLNVNHKLKDFNCDIRNKATSLNIELDKIIDMDEIFFNLLTTLDNHIYSYFSNPDKKLYLKEINKLIRTD